MPSVFQIKGVVSPLPPWGRGSQSQEQQPHSRRGQLVLRFPRAAGLRSVEGELSAPASTGADGTGLAAPAHEALRFLPGTP